MNALRALGLLRTTLTALSVAFAAPLAAQPVNGPAKFIPTFLVYYGGAPALTAADAQRLANFDLIDIDRFRYADIAPTTWAAAKALNPALQFYLYQMGAEAPNYLDTTAPQWLNGLGRYNVSRGHSMGSLNGNHPELFLLDAAGNRIYNTWFSNVGANQLWQLMDFGSPAYQAYWVEAVRADIANQPWRADGVHADNCLTLSAAGGYSATSVKYPTDTAWSDAMTSFAAAVSAGLHGDGQKLWCNRGESRTVIGAAAWRALDASATPPDVVAEEGAFAVTWGPWATQFYSEAEWKRQVDTIGAMVNSKVAVFSHTALAEGASGSDNWGRPVTYWQTLWYALGSFLLSKNATLNNAYFNFSGNGGAYDRIWWYPEYKLIDLGNPVGNYAVSNVGGVNVYRREFQNGYVYVNPTATDVATVTVPQLVKVLTHDNVALPLGGLPDVSAIALGGHTAAIVVKSSLPGADTTPPSVPTGLAATAASSTQVNLTWNASTDNVAVTGYYVYLNDAPLTTTTATSFQHTGLTAATTYNYRVSAFDTVPNHSAWTATPVAVSTPPSAPPPDTTAPSVPTGLAATAASSTQVNLSWNASTDNVAVTGYYVYLNNAPLTTTTATSFQHTGLTAGTTYNYRVSAYDAVPNHSAWTATPVSVTTPPPPDTAAPTVPAGLAGSAASSTQINLAWSASTDNVGVSGYRVYRAGALIATTAAPSYADAGLAASTSYSYSVAAFDAAGNASAPSAAVSATTLAPPDTSSPSVPAGLGAVASSASQINLNWTASTDNVGVAGYRVYRGGTQIATTAAPSYANTGLAASTTYSYAVSAFDASGNLSAQSAAVTARTQAKPDSKAPTIPGGLGATAASSRLITLNWNASTDNVGVSGYKVYRGGVQVATVGTPAYGDASVLPATAYSYRVAAYDAAGNTSAKSNSVSATTPASRTRGDFDGDGKADILWRDAASGQDLIWFMNGAVTTASGTAATVADLNWVIAGIGDFNGNGRTDILWRNRATGENAIWIMNGTAIVTNVTFSTIADQSWEVAGVGDFNGDGKADILWRNRATGANVLWFMNGTAITASVTLPPQADLDCSVAGVGDFNGDGKADILWRNRATGEAVLWLMNGGAVTATSSIGTAGDLDWSIAGVGDFNGDGKADILWHHATTGGNTVWLMNGASIAAAGAVAAMPTTGWSVAGVADFDGDGKADILWREAASGNNALYQMDGLALRSLTYMGSLAGASWQVALR